MNEAERIAVAMERLKRFDEAKVEWVQSVDGRHRWSIRVYGDDWRMAWAIDPDLVVAIDRALERHANPGWENEMRQQLGKGGQ